jgi:hypothetical protein
MMPTIGSDATADTLGPGERLYLVPSAAVPEITIFVGQSGASYVRRYERLSEQELADFRRARDARTLALIEKPLPDDFRAVEMAWLQVHGRELAEQHAGEWIAIDGPQLVASAPDLPTLLARAAEAGHPDPLVTAVPLPSSPRYLVG